jgi:hypothetical protein
MSSLTTLQNEIYWSTSADSNKRECYFGYCLLYVLFIHKFPETGTFPSSGTTIRKAATQFYALERASPILYVST